MTKTKSPKINGRHVAEMLAHSTSVLVDNEGLVEVWPFLPEDSIHDECLVVLLSHDDAYEAWTVERESADQETGRRVTAAQVLARSAAVLNDGLAEDFAKSFGPAVV